MSIKKFLEKFLVFKILAFLSWPMLKLKCRAVLRRNRWTIQSRGTSSRWHEYRAKGGQVRRRKVSERLRSRDARGDQPGAFPVTARMKGRVYLLSSLEKEAGVVASIRARVRCFKAASNSAWTFSIKPSRRWTSQARGNPGSTHSTCWNAFTALKHKNDAKTIN